MNAKRILALLCALVTGLAFGGCGKTAPNKSEASTAAANGTLVVGTEIGYPPFEMYMDDGVTEVGLDIDLARAIGEQLGMDVKFQNTDFEGILDGLAIDKYDIVMSAVTITPARAKKVEFSEPYIENWQSIVVRRGSEPITSPEGLNGKVVGYQKATTSTAYLNKLRDTGAVEPKKVNEFEKVMDCMNDLKLGRLDVVLVDSVVADDYVAREPNVFEITWVQSTVAGEEPELFGVGIKKGNTELLNKVNGALRELKRNGRYDEICLDWGLDKSRVGAH
jgi:polar amino acid transport system substrate-binding protein